MTRPVVASDASVAEGLSQLVVPDGVSPVVAESRRTELAPVEAEASVAPAALEPEIRPSSRKLWSSAALKTDKAFEGTLEAEDIVDLVLLFLDRADMAEPEWDPSGSIKLALGDDPDFGSASLHVYHAFEGGEREFMLKLELKESPLGMGPSSPLLSNKVDFSFGLTDEGLYCRSFAYSNPIPSPELYDRMRGAGSRGIGGIADFSPQSASWKAMSLTYAGLPDGTPGVRQNISEPYNRQVNRVPSEKVGRLAASFASLRSKLP